MNNDENKYISVSALNKYLYYKFDNDLNLRMVYLKAEVSNTRLSKGILYFVLKDSESEINALMYSNLLDRLNFNMEDGITVLVSGKVSLYHKRGTYAITVYSIEQVGLGEAYLNFLKLKDKLSKEGLFNDEYKKPIKKFNHKIGLITSSTGDAMHDVISTVHKRYPLSEVVLYPAIVQGETAPLSLINAINKANDEAVCDCLIICRGGGTIEDLSCFNDEQLARTIFDSAIPTISGVGHEADFTICDFVSSRRAPTPTGAAMIATPDINDLIKDINDKNSSLVNSIKSKLVDSYKEYKKLSDSYILTNFDNVINNLNDKVDSYFKRLNSLSPLERIDNYLNNVNNIYKSISKDINKIYNEKENSFNNLLNKLIILNPLNIMSKGYTVTFQEGKIISNISDVDETKELETHILGGKIISSVTKIIKDKEE